MTRKEAAKPTMVQPGTEDKINILRWRVKHDLPLFIEGDNNLPVLKSHEKKLKRAIKKMAREFDCVDVDFDNEEPIEEIDL